MRDAVRNYCAQAGKDPLLTQGAGGNVSWKEGGVLWIKASGAWLAHAATDDIFVAADLDALKSALAGVAEEPRLPAAPAGAAGNGRRPSIETFMHAVMPHPVVAHLHAVEALAVLVRPNAKQLLEKRLGRRFAWTWVAYHRPGAALARAVAKARQCAPGADLVFLQNHGVLAGGADVDAVDRLISQAVAVLKQELRVETPAAAAPSAPPLAVGDATYDAIEDARIQSLAHLPGLYRRLSRDWALYPDHVVFLGERAAAFDRRDLAERHGNRQAPPLFFIRGEGVFAPPGFDAARRAQLECYYEVLARQAPQDALVELTPAEITELTSWEAEKYRKNLSENGRTAGTGAGRGA